MAETSYPFAGGGGVTDAVYEQLMAPVTGNGRVSYRPTANELALPILYADSTGRQVKVRANTAYLLRGFRWQSGTDGVVRPLDANTSGNPRLDLGVLRLDRTNFTVRFEILKGTPAASPTVPVVTQQTGTTGRFEVPLGVIRVASSNTVGQPSIASSDVTLMETWVAPPNAIGHSSRRGAVDPGGLYTEYDTGKVYAGLSSTWHLIGEDGAWTNQPALSPGWDHTKNSVYMMRRNGWTYLQGLVYKASPSTDVAANVDVRVCTLAEKYRPAIGSFYFEGSMVGNAHVRMHLNGATGEIYMFDHPVFKAGNFVHFGPIAYPSR